MSCLLLRLHGPLQSWGYRSRFSERDTGWEPTKSGVIGLICCALGRDRSEGVEDLAQLQVHVRVDKEGTILKDFHTSGGGVFRGSRDYYAPRSSGGHVKNAVLTQRSYLQDARFLVAIEGERALLEKIEQALADPAWPLSLGRRSCPPSEPVLVGLVDKSAKDALLQDAKPASRLVWELKPGDTAGEERPDVPQSWTDSRSRHYSVRFVSTQVLPSAKPEADDDQGDTP